MAISVTPLLTLISDCEATTGWSGGSPALSSDIVRQGTNSLGEKVSQTLGAVAKFDHALTSGTASYTGMQGAIADDGGVQTVQTTAANNDTANDMTLLPAVPVVDDAYYFGGVTDRKWGVLGLNVGQNGVGTWTVTWEYWNGTIWAALTGVSDGSSGFTAGTGVRKVTWTIPTDWATSTIQTISAYWVRARVSSFTSVTTQPLGTRSFVPIDMTSQCIYTWMLTTSTLTTKANGGMRIYAEDISGNWREWYVSGSDTYTGGWFRACTYGGASGDNVSAGTYDPQLHRYTGVRFNISSKQSGAADNCFWDFLHWGTGLRITSGATDAITWENLFSTDDAAAYGIVTKSFGVYIVTGELRFGSTSAGINVDFKDTNQIVIFRQNVGAAGQALVPSALYTITVEANATGTINWQLGNKSGTSGISGCTIKAGGTTTNEQWLLTATDTNIDVLKLYGSSFLGASTISLPANAAGREVLNCSFESCAEILPDTCVVTNCKIISSDNRGLRISSTTHSVTASDFISCVRATHIPTAGTYTYDALKFSGSSTADIENSSVGAVIVNATNGANPGTVENSGGGTTTINNAVNLTVKVVDLVSGAVVQNAQVFVSRNDNGAILMNEATNVNGIATETFNYTADVAITVRVRKSTTETQYVPVQVPGTITTDGFTLTQALTEDTIVENP